MSAISVNKIAVDWTTAPNTKNSTCVGVFAKGVDTKYVIKELNNAPVDLESCKSRMYVKSHPGSEADPLTKGYTESRISIKVPFTNETFLKESIDKSIWDNINSVSTATETGFTTLYFSTELKSASKEKQA